MKSATILLRDSSEKCQALVNSKMSIDDFVSNMIVPKIETASTVDKNEGIIKVGISPSLHSENLPTTYLSVAPLSTTLLPQPAITEPRRFKTPILDELQQYLLDHSMSPGKDETECIARGKMLEQQLNPQLAAERSSSPVDAAAEETASNSDGSSMGETPGFIKRIFGFK